MDDAASPTARRRPASRAGLVVVPLGVLLGAGLAIPLAARLAPPATPFYVGRAGDFVARGARPELVRAQVARRLARAAADREGADARRRRLRVELTSAAEAGPAPALGRTTACAALLRGWTLVLRGLAGPPDAPRGTGGRGPAAELRAEQASVEGAALAGDPQALEGSFALEQAGWRRWIEAEARRRPAPHRAVVWADWRARIEARADRLEELAAEIEARASGAERRAVPAEARRRALAIEPLVPDPGAALASLPVEPGSVTVHPLRSSWRAPVAAGALAGALLGLLTLGASALGRRARRSGRAPEPGGGVPAVPERAWLQVVAGSGRAPVARAVCELAARALARRERVVVIDLGEGLDLHAVFRLSPRLGWSDVARDGLPALGVLQNGGFTGLFLLARGSERRGSHWLALDRVLEELRPHFGRVIAAVDRRVPATVGGVLAGRVSEGWWAGRGIGQRPARDRAGRRLAISLRDIELSGVPKASLEALEARLAGLTAASSRTPRTASGADSVGRPPEPAPRVSAPVVLDCDLQLRRRLRYLAWMRRVQAERRSRETESAPKS